MRPYEWTKSFTLTVQAMSYNDVICQILLVITKFYCVTQDKTTFQLVF